MSLGIADGVIVAAGSSSRMGGLDKLEAQLLGWPLLRWTVEQLSQAPTLRRLVVVTAAGRVERLRSLPWLIDHGVRVVAGGESRSESVLAGVRATDAPLVVVHDGARPLASPRLVEAVLQAAAVHGAAIPVVPVVDALKRVVQGSVEERLERAGVVRAQTPQAARRELLLAAFAAAGEGRFDDEASLLEAHGVRVATVPGEAHNIKVTEPADLALVGALLETRNAGQTRVGLGQDSHPFGPQDRLWLGGLEFAEAPRLFGHSDGDVCLHALASALLSAAGLGDLGRHFPPTDPATRGIASSELLRLVLARVEEEGWRPAAAQVVLLGARPRLGAARLAEIRTRVAELLGIAAEVVALSASTGNLSGPEGAGRAISATASVSLVRR